MPKTGANPPNEAARYRHNGALLAPGRRNPLEHRVENRVAGQLSKLPGLSRQGSPWRYSGRFFRAYYPVPVHIRSFPICPVESIPYRISPSRRAGSRRAGVYRTNLSGWRLTWYGTTLSGLTRRRTLSGHWLSDDAASLRAALAGRLPDNGASWSWSDLGMNRTYPQEKCAREHQGLSC